MFAAELNAHPLHDWLETDYRPFPRRQERDAWNALPESKRAQLLSWADEARQGYPMVTATQFLAFCRTGDRTAYEKPYFARRNRLMGAALAMMTDAGRSAMLNPGPHGFSEVLYAVSSAANNNGSAFAGLSANSPFWNCLLAFCMFVGRFGVIIPVMAIAGSLVSKKSQAASSGTLPTHGPLFVGLLIGTVLLVGALTFIPALALGPVAEYLS